MIRFQKISFSYEPEESVLRSTNLELRSGLILLLGPNGCGKSTLLRLAAGVERPDAGLISIDDHDLWKDEVKARRTLAYLPEHPDLTPYASIGEIINLVCRLRNEPLDKGKEALKTFGVHTMSRRSVRELSRGERRRAVFAAAFVGAPKNTLLDEPLEGMDRSIQTHIIDWISNHVKSGALVVVVSHRIEPFIELAAEAVTIDKGKIVHFKTLPKSPDEKLNFLDGISKGNIPIT